MKSAVRKRKSEFKTGISNKFIPPIHAALAIINIVIAKTFIDDRDSRLLRFDKATVFVKTEEPKRDSW